MPTPIETQILDALELRLRNIKEINGYFTTLSVIERARLTPFQSDDIPAMNYWAGPDVKKEEGGGYTIRTLEVSIEYHSKTRDRPFVDVSQELAADIKVALNRASELPAVTDQPSPRLGGLVAGIDVISNVPAIGEGQAPWCGTLVTLAIDYGVKFSDPFVIVI